MEACSQAFRREEADSKTTCESNEHTRLGQCSCVVLRLACSKKAGKANQKHSTKTACFSILSNLKPHKTGPNVIEVLSFHGSHMHILYCPVHMLIFPSAPVMPPNFPIILTPCRMLPPLPSRKSQYPTLIK